MNTLTAFLIGVVQGLGEFLPISSSGHLVLLYQLFNIHDNNLLLTIFLHIATLFSILYVYRRQVWQLITHPFCKTNKLLIVGTIPTVIIGLILKSIISGTYESDFVIFGFLITATTLGVADYLTENRLLVTNTPNTASKNALLKLSTPEIKTSKSTIKYQKPQIEIHRSITNIDIKYWQALIIGIAQGFACFPGISRSGSTIATGLMLNCNKPEATTFSFLLSIPVIIGSMFLGIMDLKSHPSNWETAPLIIACVVSFLVGIISIALINLVVKKQKLSYFSYYLIILVFIVLIVKLI